MTPLNPSAVTLLVLVPLIVWRMYSRFRRMVGRQRLSRVRPWVTLTIFPALILFIGLATLSQPQRLLWLAAGLLAGALLGVFGLGKTHFEPTPQGLFYTPNAHLGIALSLLFVARIAYRLIEIYAIDPGVPQGMDDFARSPLTLVVFGLLAGYYVAYAVGLVRWRFRVLRAKREREAARAVATPTAATTPTGPTPGEAS
jgi:hypothetical protein